MTQKERDKKIDEMHEALMGSVDKPGLCERVRTLESKPIWTKEFIASIGSIAAVIGMIIKMSLHGGK